MEEIIFPNQIRLQRRLKGISMQALADHLGVSLSAVSKIEKGYRRLNQNQLISVAELTDCSLQDLYVNEQNSKPEIIDAWRHEQERRKSINIDAGLKTLGAALRRLRFARGLTLMEVAERADMTLSVYHRIEMGQREVSDYEYSNIAKAFSLTVAEMDKAIKKLRDSGELEEIKEKIDTKFKSLATPKGSNVSMYGVFTGELPKVKVFGKADANGNIVLNCDDPDAKEAVCPSQLMGKKDVYAINLCTRRLGSLLPNRAVLFIDPQEMISVGDIAAYYLDDNTIALVSVRENENGELYGMRFNPDEKIDFTGQDLSKIHKIVVITL